MRKATMKKITIGLVIALVMVVGTRAALATGPVNETIMLSLANYVNQHPDKEVALKLMDLVAGMKDESLGSAYMTRSNENSNFNEMGLIDYTNRRVQVKGLMWTRMPVAGDTSTTTAYLTNGTAGDIYLDTNGIKVIWSGTVSSSVNFGMGTSSVNGLAAYSSTLPSNLLSIQTWVTSTAFTTYNKTQFSTTTYSLYPQVPLKTGESVVAGWLQTWSASTANCTGATCEAVTSSARGYEAEIYVPYTRYINY